MRGQDDTEKECPTSNTKSPPVEGADSSIQTEKVSPTLNTQSVEEVVDPKLGKALPFSHTSAQLEQHLLWEAVVDPEVWKALPYL